MWVRNGKAWDDLDPDYQMARDFIKTVDDKASRADAYGTPLFGPSRGAVEKAEELARMLKRRANPNLDVQNGG